MTNIKATKRALGSSVLALFLCFAMLLGTTFAWFTDTVTSANNIITAGNLDVELEYKKIVDGKIADKWASVNEETKLFDEATLWEPGHAEVVYLKVSNLGTLALKYQLSVTVLENIIGYTIDNEMVNLTEHLVFKVVELEENEIGAYDVREAVVDAKDAMGLNNYLGTTKALDAKDGANDEDYVALIVYMPETVGNEANYRGEDVPYIKLGVDLFATQYTYEADSFGPDYDADANEGFKVTTGADLQAAINNAKPGETIVLEKDIVAEEPIVIAAPAATTYAMRNVNAIVIDLNGKTLTADIVVSEGAVAVIKNGNIKNYSDDNSAIETVGNLTLDNLTITSTRHAVRVEGGVTVINGGTYKVGGYAGRTQHAVNVSDGGEVVINGGNFVGPKGTASDSGAAVNVQADSTVTINGGNFSGGKTNTVSAKGTLVVKGGTFDQDPSNVTISKITYNYVAADYKAIESNGTYYVVFEGDFDFVDVVTSVEELQDALDAATGEAIIYVGANIAGNVTVTQKPDVKIAIEGNGYNFAGVITVDGKSGTYTTAGLTIKNVNFVADSISADACIRLGDGTNATRYTCNVTVENCTFDVPGAVGVKSYTGGDKNVTITGCTATANAHSLAQLKGVDGVIVDGCKVYSKNGINFNNSTNVVVKNSIVDVNGYAVRFGESSGGAGAAETYTIENCTLKSACNDGDAVIVLRGTADNATLTVTDTTIDGDITVANTAVNATVIVDGNIVATPNNVQTIINNVTDKAIVLAPGVYDKTIVMKSGVTLIGSEGAVVHCINLNGSANVTLKGITFDAAGAKYSYDAKGKAIQPANIISRDSGSNVAGAANIVIDGCTFGGTFADGGVVIAFTDQGKTGYSNITITGCTFAVKGGYADIYTYYSGNNGSFKIENNTFSSTYAMDISNMLPIYLGKYQSSTPVVVTGNKFETKASIDAAAFIQDHSNYGVSIDASNNTFAN